MNELQLVLIVLAILVIISLYFFQNKKEKTIEKKKNSDKAHSDAEDSLNDLGDSHIPVLLPQHSTSDDTVDPKVPESQLNFSFDDNDEKLNSPHPSVNVEKNLVETPRKPKHIILESEELHEDPAFEHVIKDENKSKIENPNFGIPAEQKIDSSTLNIETKNSEVFIIMIMGTEDFKMTDLNLTLHGVGLTLSDKNIFVKKDSYGKDIIKVANLLEPGTFSKDQLEDENLTSSGVVLILELPCTVKAPAAMDDMIKMARKISQRLNGRLYDMKRQLIKESCIQKMRDQAVAYESTAI